MDVGTVLYDAGPLAGGFAALWGAVQATRAHHQVKVNGQAGGQTLGQMAVGNRLLLDKLIELEAYQHTRNHDILNAIAAGRLDRALIERLVETIERLLTAQAALPPHTGDKPDG